MDATIGSDLVEVSANGGEKAEEKAEAARRRANEGRQSVQREEDGEDCAPNNINGRREERQSMQRERRAMRRESKLGRRGRCLCRGNRQGWEQRKEGRRSVQREEDVENLQLGAGSEKEVQTSRRGEAVDAEEIVERSREVAGAEREEVRENLSKLALAVMRESEQAEDVIGVEAVCDVQR
ncbi:hypothetical protein Syun_023356 [Stephania yunnanensis]|uniref:Uncharacterized protein n=1 Tax=Stephania yunnanensis TaxID=152371 RepID=A0AAP0FBK2_9MAGN